MNYWTSKESSTQYQKENDFLAWLSFWPFSSSGQQHLNATLQRHCIDPEVLLVGLLGPSFTTSDCKNDMYKVNDHKLGGSNSSHKNTAATIKAFDKAISTKTKDVKRESRNCLEFCGGIFETSLWKNVMMRNFDFEAITLKQIKIL